MLLVVKIKVLAEILTKLEKVRKNPSEMLRDKIGKMALPKNTHTRCTESMNNARKGSAARKRQTVTDIKGGP